MKKLDRYILGKFLTTFLFCLLLFTLIVVVIDWSEKADDFVKSKLSAWQIFTDYQIGFIPKLDAMLFPLFVFIAVIFFTSKMAERSEIVAILSSGVSFRRFLLPYWVGGLLLTLVLWSTNHFILPRANVIWSEFIVKYVDANSGTVNTNTQNYYFRLDTNSYAGIRYYDTLRKYGNIFFIDRFANNKLTHNLRAESINWDTATKKWKLNNVVERSFNAAQKESMKFSRSKIVDYNFTPRDLGKDVYLKERLSTAELNRVIKLEKLRGSEAIKDYQVERYNRDAVPISVIILTLIGAILASRKARGGSGSHLAVGVLLSVLYILFGKLAFVFATKGSFSPWLAAWLPNIVFGMLAYYLYRRVAR